MWKQIFFCILKINEERRKDPLVKGTDPDPYQDFMDPQHCFLRLYFVLKNRWRTSWTIRRTRSSGSASTPGTRCSTRRSCGRWSSSPGSTTRMSSGRSWCWLISFYHFCCSKGVSSVVELEPEPEPQLGTVGTATFCLIGTVAGMH